MHFVHDKHSYFFEKYLRKEMDVEESDAFEEKLNTDIDFKNDFENYILHRDEIVKIELEEYQKEIIPEKPSKAYYSWILVALSLLSLVLLLDYYASKNYDKKQPEEKSYTQKIINRINNAIIKPFTFKKDSNEKQKDNKLQVQKTQENEENELLIDEKIINADSIALLETGENDWIKVSPAEADEMLFDTIIHAVDLEKFKEKLRLISTVTDSTLDDSILTKISIRSAAKTKGQQNIKPIYVEFWKSILDYSGYKFNGKKLLIYGIEKPFEIYLLKQENTIILRSVKGENALLNDNEFHNL